MPASSILTPDLAFAMGGVTIRAAIAAHAQVGRGDEQAADEAAAVAMLDALNQVEMSGRIVIGEGAHGHAAGLSVDAQVGAGGGPEVDIAVDPLEGVTPTAKAMANALVVAAAAPRGGLMRVPDIYMEKLAIGPGYPRDVVDLDAPAGENAQRLANAKGVDVREITACVLDRPRHEKIVTDLRRVGARINLIPDGDVAGVIYTGSPEAGVDMYIGQGGAPEGVPAAAALRCVGGQMQARLVIRNESDRQMARRAGIETFDRRFSLDDLVAGETIFAATGVTKGGLLDGAVRGNHMVTTWTLLMSSVDRVSRTIKTATPISA